MRNLRARYWKSTSTYLDAKDCLRHDPHNFGLDLISTMNYYDNGGDYGHPLTYDDIKQIKTIRHRGNSFGYEVTVVAPRKVWDKAREALKQYNKAV